MSSRESRATFFLTPQFEQNRFPIAESTMKSITKALEIIPRNPSAKTITESEPWRSRGSRVFNVAQFVALKDGIDVFWNTKGFLEYRTHRITFLDDGEIEYYRYPYDVDCQSIGSDEVRLSGLEQITGDNEATVGLLYASEVLEIGAREITHGPNSLADQ